MKNVLGTDLKCCGTKPVTGYFRDGFCRTTESDQGRHVVASVVDEKFLVFSRQIGNDLSTPNPMYNFPGLKPGDKWCLCENRWNEAYLDNVAPKVIRGATNMRTKKKIRKNINETKNDFPEKLTQSATSLSIETKHSNQRELVCAMVLTFFERLLDDLDSVTNEWTKYCAHLNEITSFNHNLT